GSGPERAKRMWTAVLISFLEERLVPLGDATLCVTSYGKLGVKLTERGAYLLGAADHFDYGVPTESPVVVQPNFEIVFLDPSPLGDAQPARAAGRIGNAPGTVFRLPRAAVLDAAAAGAQLDDLLGLLRSSSTQPPPGNVARQIRDWHGELRRVSMRNVLLIDC